MDLRKRIIYLVMGPLLYALFANVLTGAGVMASAPGKGIGIAAWMIFWWVTRPVDITVTALLPVILNALIGIVPMDGVISQYSSSSIILIFGSCLLTGPWSSIGLDKRISLKALSIIGPSIRSQIIVWLITAIILSNMMPNVVVVAILTPIAVAMLNAAGYTDIKNCEVATPILCAICWGAQVGGAGTPLGGAMNITAISFIEEFIGKEFMYIDWLIRMMPYTIVATIAVLLVMILRPMKTKTLDGTREYFKNRYKELGPVKKDEIVSLVLFVSAMLGSFIRPLYADIFPGLVPAYLFLILGFLNFIIISFDTKKPLMDWNTAQKEVMWGMLVLFAGGLALGQILTGSGANEVVASVITGGSMTAGLWLVVIFAVIACLVSELTNSTVSAAVTIPIVIAVCSASNLQPIPYIFTAAMAMNFESLLPVSVRAISVGYGLYPGKLLKEGIPVMLIRMLMAILVGYLMLTCWSGFGTLM